jgi:hypothetical protein
MGMRSVSLRCASRAWTSTWAVKALWLPKSLTMAALTPAAEPAGIWAKAFKPASNWINSKATMQRSESGSRVFTLSGFKLLVPVVVSSLLRCSISSLRFMLSFRTGR